MPKANTSPLLTSNQPLPDRNGHFGPYGGRYVAETLMPLILEVEKAYTACKADPAFQKEIDYYFEHYVGRPSPMYFAERLTAAAVPDRRCPVSAAPKQQL